MNKQFAALAILGIVLTSFQAPALANDPWFDRWDHNHDHHWTYEEFKKAHWDWYRTHKEEKRLSDAELRAEFDHRAMGHPGWVGPEEIRDYHHW